jgi:uncharacterized protein (TIGR03435 family)
MTPAIKGILLAISGSLAASIVAKVTITTALGLAAAWLARGNRAAVRHALLAVTFGVTLLLPIVSIVMPPLTVGVPVQVESRAASLPLAIDVNADRSAPTAGAGSRAAPAAPQVLKLSLSNLLLAGWASGVALFLLPVLLGLWQIRSLRRSGLPWRRGQSVVEALALDAGIDRRVEVLLHEALPGPMTCGTVRPAIVLPRDAENWNPEDLNRAIIHELEHVRRGDSVSRCLARVAGAVYWFHPMVWIAWRRLVLEAERSCDDAVLRHSEATAYADQLVGLAKRLSVAQRSPLLAMANRSDLSTRVGALLDGRQRRGRAGTKLVAFACAAAAVLIVAISPLRTVAAPQGNSSASPRNAQKFEVASVRLEDPHDPHSSPEYTNSPGFRTTPTVFPSNRLTMRFVNLQILISEAFGVDYRDIFGGPDWLARPRYDLDAKVEGNALLTKEQMRPMLQNLLEERFHLKARHEQKIVAGYALVVAKNGPRLQPNKGAPFQGMFAGYEIRYQNVSVADFAVSLAGRANGRGPVKGPIIDRTGIKGKYDFDLKYGPHDPDDSDFAQIPENLYANLPDIFTVLQEKYGLKLVPEKITIDTLVIDHVDKVPTEN